MLNKNPVVLYISFVHTLDALKSNYVYFSAHLAKGIMGFCHHMASVARRLLSVVCHPLTFHILIHYGVTFEWIFRKFQGNPLRVTLTWLPERTKGHMTLKGWKGAHAQREVAQYLP
jgi:hypothetical protein